MSNLDNLDKILLTTIDTQTDNTTMTETDNETLTDHCIYCHCKYDDCVCEL